MLYLFNHSAPDVNRPFIPFTPMPITMLGNSYGFILSQLLILFFLSYLLKVRQIPGVKILRYSASLYYANIEHFLLMLSMQVKNDDDRREDSGNKLRFNDYSFDKSDTIFDVVDSDKNSYNMNRYQNGNGYAGKSNEVRPTCLVFG